MPTGATIDFKIEAPSKNLRFVIEVTGTKNKIHKDSYKISQALQYLTQKENENEKIVILANTYRHKKISERGENFTGPVITIATNNKFCLMTTVDLYYLWRDLLDGKKSKEEILQSIFDTIGVYKYQQ